MATHIIWSKITPQESHQILCDVQDTEKRVYRSALEILSQQMQKRVPIVIEMPKIERHTVWQSILGHPLLENLSFNILSTWLVNKHSALLCAWLDAIGIAHDPQGYFSSDSIQEPSAEKLSQAISTVLEKFPQKNLSIYLRVFNQIEGIQWNALNTLIESDPRLQLT